ncbi:hypothetical protein BH20VER3_BH20VER3_07240 [soil metagenome]
MLVDVGFDPESTERFHLLGVVIEHRGAEAVPTEQTGDDVSEAAHSGDDDGIVLFVDLVRLAFGQSAGKTRLHEGACRPVRHEPGGGGINVCS